jgi:hypothetical protein
MGWLASRTSNTADLRNHRRDPPALDRRKSGTQNQAIGRSRGTLTIKIIPLLDALGNLARFVLDTLVDIYIYSTYSIIRPALTMFSPKPTRVRQEFNPLRSARVPVKPGCAVREASVANEIESCAELCCAALATDPLASVSQLRLVPQSPQDCFDLVLGIPYDARCMEVVRRLKRDAAERGLVGPLRLSASWRCRHISWPCPGCYRCPCPTASSGSFASPAGISHRHCSGRTSGWRWRAPRSPSSPKS